MMDDATAIKKCKSGDKEAFRHLVERYQAQAIGHATSILDNREDGLDAVQEESIDAFQALERYEAMRKFYPWFYVILRNRCYKLVAGRSRQAIDSADEMQILAPTPSLRLEETLLLHQVMLELKRG